MINGVRFKINETKDGEKKMERVVFVQFIKEGCQEAYEKAHSPELFWRCGRGGHAAFRIGTIVAPVRRSSR